MSTLIGGNRETSTVGSYDLIVVGGGIHGGCLLLEASVAGLDAILLERADFGGGTSWASLRILHGGLRYLQGLDLGRFRQSVAERRWFMRSFPDHVRPLPCLMPLYGEGLRRVPVMQGAMAVNDLLSRDRNRGLAESLHLPRGRILDGATARKRVPIVPGKGLDGAALWYDGVMTNPPRILMEILRWASSRGGRALNYVDVQQITTRAGTVSGVTGIDRIRDREVHFRAPRVALCVGPDQNVVDTLVGGSGPPPPPPSVGFNLVLRRRLPTRGAIAVGPRVRGGQIYFLHSVGDLTLAGTVHRPGSAPLPTRPNDPLVQGGLEELGRAVPGWGLGRDDVVGVLPGVIPARAPGTTEPMKRERIVDHAKAGAPKGLVTVVGVKYTTARDVARQALRTLAPEAAPEGREPPVRPDSLPTLPSPGLEQFLDLSSTDPGGAREFVHRLVEEEAAETPEDIVLRRMDWGLDAGRAEEAVARLQALMPERLGRIHSPPGTD